MESIDDMFDDFNRKAETKSKFNNFEKNLDNLQNQINDVYSSEEILDEEKMEIMNKVNNSLISIFKEMAKDTCLHKQVLDIVSDNLDKNLDDIKVLLGEALKFNDLCINLILESMVENELITINNSIEITEKGANYE